GRGGKYSIAVACTVPRSTIGIGEIDAAWRPRRIRGGLSACFRSCGNTVHRGRGEPVNRSADLGFERRFRRSPDVLLGLPLEVLCDGEQLKPNVLFLGCCRQPAAILGHRL